MINFSVLGSSLKLALLSLLFLTLIEPAKATHIRAGEIVAVRTSGSGLTYTFTVIGYTDTGTQVIFGGGQIDFGDGTVLTLGENGEKSESIHLEDEVAYNYFEISHTFSAPGKYTIRYNERNRNAGVKNMSNSVDTPFYIETAILVDPLVGMNNTPVFLVPPIDKGAVGVAFFHNPGAYDSDGDSLSFRLAQPKQAIDREVNNYLSPADSEFYANYVNGNEAQNGVPTFGINALTGELYWDAPGAAGEYNMAFIVDEWRNVEGEWFLLGSVTRDMQVIIEDTDNHRPELAKITDLCLGAGETASTTIRASDPDGHEVKIEGFGAPFDFELNSATISKAGSFESSPSHQSFEWTTTCDQVSPHQYPIFVKATDNPELGPKLVDFELFQIRLTVPTPSGLTLEDLSEDEMPLSWDSYSACEITGVNVWRKVGTGIAENNDCEIQDLRAFGYSYVTFSSSKTSYIDQNLIAGAKHCYTLQAGVSGDLDGVSKPSADVCFTMPAISAVPVKVDVTKTDKTNGSVKLEWLAPFDLDNVSALEPFFYEIFRGTSESNMNKVGTSDESNYTDSGMNSVSSQYYRIDTYDKDMNLIAKSAVASTVNLSARNAGLSVQLDWDVDVPWSVHDQDHVIYRDHVDSSEPSKFVEIGKVNPSAGMIYSDEDNSLEPGVDYTYYVEVNGDYHNEDISTEIVNRSQKVTAQVVVQNAPSTDREILVYPNPFKGFLNVENMGVNETFSLINSDGKVLLSNLNTSVLDGSWLPTGLYYLKLSSGETIRVLKK